MGEGAPPGTEVLDDPRADPSAALETLRDVARCNAAFGGTRAVVEALEPFFRSQEPGVGSRGERHWTLLDVGTGLGDIPRAAAAAARRYGIRLQLIGVERIPVAARAARVNGVAAIIADGGALPFAPRSVDIVIVSQVLHHLPRAVAVRWIAGVDRLARRAVVLADLRRSPLAMAGVWLAAVPLRLSARGRRDAVVSLRRGYRRAEFQQLLRDAGVHAEARYRPVSRVVAAWAPNCSLQPSAFSGQLNPAARLTADS